jgi:glutathionyl-hydroquinone reductase
MGVLIDGVWRDQELPQEVGRAGDFRRADSIFRDRITPPMDRPASRPAIAARCMGSID